MSINLVKTQIDNQGVQRLTLCDASTRNSLSEAMLTCLSEHFAIASNDPAVRVIILAAEGPAFCSGHNLKELTSARVNEDGGKAYFCKIMQMCASMMQSIVNCPKPVIAEVNGIATAAGCQLVASCDLAVASDQSKFSTPGVHIGLFCSTPMVALSRNVSNKHAMEMLLTGDMISASRAVEMGLINQVVSADSLQEATDAIASKIASKSSMTLAIGKKAFYAQREMPLSDAYQYASEVMVRNMLAQDAKEGIDAFIEKRKPKWQNK
ncbi:MAG: enoyl-CoA hydratase [Oceanospirillales bacterium]|nr:MAG: enoyl-CoA hydratase [Oceanospirillales bacterium]